MQMIIYGGAAFLFLASTIWLAIVVLKKNNQIKCLENELLKEKRNHILTKISRLGCKNTLADVAKLRALYLTSCSTKEFSSEVYAVDIAIQAHFLEKYGVFPKDQGIDVYIKTFNKDFLLKQKKMLNC